MRSSRRSARMVVWILAIPLAATVIGPGAIAATLTGASADVGNLPMAEARIGTGDPHQPRSEAAATRTLPFDLMPSLSNAKRVKPRSYTDGCHAGPGQTKAKACIYGTRSSTKKVLLFGDSHAAQWLPALEDIASREGWKLYYLTKSACPVPKVTVMSSGEPRRDCNKWRRNAMSAIADIHPDLVIASSLNHRYQIQGSPPATRARLWREGWVSSLRSLKARASKVILLGDTPTWAREPVPCLRTNENDIGKCDTKRSVAISKSRTALDRRAADEANVPYVNIADVVCNGDPCRAVSGRYLVLYDTAHMTVAWARHVDRDLLARLPTSMLPTD